MTSGHFTSTKMVSHPCSGSKYRQKASVMKGFTWSFIVFSLSSETVEMGWPQPIAGHYSCTWDTFACQIWPLKKSSFIWLPAWLFWSSDTCLSWQGKSSCCIHYFLAHALSWVHKTWCWLKVPGPWSLAEPLGMLGTLCNSALHFKCSFSHKI